MPIAVGTAMVIGAVISAAMTAASTAYNAYQTDKTNSQNKDLYNQGLEANKEVAQNGLTWKVEDAKRAGLSPLAALNSSTHGNLVSATNPTMQAPQVDPSALIQSLTSMSNEYASDQTRLEIEKSQAKTARYGFFVQKYIASLNNSSMEKIASDRLAWEKQQGEAELNEEIRQYNTSIALDIKKYNQTEQLKWNELNADVNENTAKRLEKIADNQWDVLSSFAKNVGIYIRSRPFYIEDESTFNEWLTLQQDFSDSFASDNKTAYDAFVAMDDDERYDFIQASKSKSKGINAGLNASGSLGNTSGTDEEVTESVHRDKVPVGKNFSDLTQGKKQSKFNVADFLLKGAGLSGGYNSAESSSDAKQKSDLEKMSRASDYYKDLTFYRPVFTDKFVKKYAGKYQYSELSYEVLDSTFKGYK